MFGFNTLDKKFFQFFVKSKKKSGLYLFYKNNHYLVALWQLRPCILLTCFGRLVTPKLLASFSLKKLVKIFYIFVSLKIIKTKEDKYFC
jgi:hypothetical protein